MATPTAYSATVLYTANDLVTYSGATYKALDASRGVTPGTDATKWLTYVSPGIARIVGAAALPSATANTNGTAVNLIPDTGDVGFANIDELELVYAAVGTETVTVTATATFSDATTNFITDTSTTSQTKELTLDSIIGNLEKDGNQVTQIAILVKSSIPSSTATVTPTVTGMEVPARVS
jgi:hypothetical protein